ncbi:MAG: ABC transporter ATP-binding protein [Candidatus Aquicultorales bacterium]
MDIIVAKDVAKVYRTSKRNQVEALRGVNLRVAPGDFTAIMGPSGSGKSTLLHVLGCLDEPDGGTIVFEGRDVTRLRPSELTRIRATKIGFIFQGFNLIPTLTSVENVMLAGEYAGMPIHMRHEKAGEMLALVGLEHRFHHLPSELSGGEQQRVAIARALVNSPAIVLADEPTGDLDSVNSAEIIKLLRNFNQENGQTFLIVTHDSDIGAKCDKIVAMKDGKIAG